jgi:hypothetical protein
VSPVVLTLKVAARTIVDRTARRRAAGQIKADRREAGVPAEKENREFRMRGSEVEDDHVGAESIHALRDVGEGKVNLHHVQPATVSQSAFIIEEHLPVVNVLLSYG